MRTLIVLCIVFNLAAAPNQRWKVESVRFTGNKSVSSSSLLSVMKTHSSNFFHTNHYSLPQVMMDLDSVTALYKRRGYLRANAALSRVKYDSSSRSVDIYIRIYEGPAYRIQSIRFTGSYPEGMHPESVYHVDAGDVFKPAQTDSARQKLLKKMADYGYLFAIVNQEIIIDTAMPYVCLLLTADRGPVVKAGTIQVLGTKFTRHSTVLRELTFTEGSVVTRPRIQSSTSNLNSTGLFTFIRIDPLDTTTIGYRGDTVTVPVIVQVKEADRLRLLVDGGYDQYEKWYGSGRILFANLYGAGQSIDLFARLSTISGVGRLTYSYPWFLNLPATLQWDIHADDRKYSLSNAVMYGSLLNATGKIGRRNTYSFWSGYDRTHWLDSSASSGTSVFGKPNTLLSGVSLLNDTRKSVINPGSAHLAYVKSEFASPIPDANNFYRIFADFRGYGDLAKRLVFSSALSAGVVEGYGAAAADVPFTELFRSGQGDIRPVRGYSMEEVTFRDPVTGIYGGKFAIVINAIEDRVVFVKWLSVAVFVDGGYVWRDASSFSFKDIRWAAGPGLRSDLPVGYLRLDYGLQLHRAPAGRFIFNLGLPF